jgi:hypothetical protein
MTTPATIELTAPQLVLLYNLLISHITLFIDRDVPDPDAATLLDQTNQALEKLIGESTWFVCVKEGCDARPYRLTVSELEAADGIISCDVCGELCHRVLKESKQTYPSTHTLNLSPARGAGLCGPLRR